MQAEGGGDELSQSNGKSSTCVPEERNDKDEIPEINDDDFDLDALAEALEQAATLASNSKKKNKSKNANTPVKCPVLKEQACDLSIPGEDKFERDRYHLCKIWVFWSDKKFAAVLPCFYTYYDKELYGGKGTVGSSRSELVLDKEIMDTANDEEEKWEGEKYEYDKAIGADRTFLKFKKRLDAYPQQCFR